MIIRVYVFEFLSMLVIKQFKNFTATTVVVEISKGG